MAGRSLAWEDSSLLLEKKREARVTKLLQSPEPSWGVTETQSAFVYPKSLDPLRRVASASFGVEASDDEKWEQPSGLDVTRILDKVVPAESAKDVEVDAVRRIEAARQASISGDMKSNQGSVDGHETVTSRGSVNNRGHRDEDRPSVPRVTTRERSRSRNRVDVVEPGSGPTAGKPVFHTYGNGNTSPATGGVLYGNYMLSHSIVPQVLPNKPHIRQVHASTQRVAERAAARARASGHIRDGNKRTLHGTASRNQNTIGCRGARGGQFAPSARCSHHVPKKGVGYRKEALRKEGSGDSNEWRKQQRVDTTPQKPVLLFSALPDCPGSRHLTKARQTRQARPISARTRRSRSHDPPPRETGILPSAPRARATRSTQTHGRHPVDVVESKSVDASYEERPEDGPPSATLHAWTSDRRLANNPRNYKLLPRGWAGELITPAGISGPEPSGVEAVCLLRGEGLRGGRGGMRDHLEESGVGACLNWNPPGSR